VTTRKAYMSAIRARAIKTDKNKPRPVFTRRRRRAPSGGAIRHSHARAFVSREAMGKVHGSLARAGKVRRYRRVVRDACARVFGRTRATRDGPTAVGLGLAAGSNGGGEDARAVDRGW